jgi:hypothetical protein
MRCWGGGSSALGRSDLEHESARMVLPLLISASFDLLIIRVCNYANKIGEKLVRKVDGTIGPVFAR